jgi:hypothetical protein
MRGSRATRVGTGVFGQRYSLVYCRPLASGYLWIRLPGYCMRILAIIGWAGSVPKVAGTLQ